MRMQFHPAGTNADAIIIHEMGHQLDGYLTAKGSLGRECKSIRNDPNKCSRKERSITAIRIF